MTQVKSSVTIDYIRTKIRRRDIKSVLSALTTTGTVESVTGDGVDNTDPKNPVLSFPSRDDIGLGTGDSPTFTDVLVDDEAYGAGWNGSLEVPTKNAVYDKIQTLSTFVVTKGTTLDRYHLGGFTQTIPSTTVALTINSLRAHPFLVHEDVTTDRLIINVTVGVSGNVIVGLYSSSQGYPSSLVFQNTISITAPGVYSVTLANISLSSGTYWAFYLTDTANTVSASAASANLSILGVPINFSPQSSTWVVARSYALGVPSTFPSGATTSAVTTPSIALRYI